MRRGLMAALVLAGAALGAMPAAAQPRFEDVTPHSGLKLASSTGVGGTNPHAVAVEDFNGDGLLDIIIPTFGKPHVYYFRNLGGLKFRDVTRGSGLETFQGAGTGAAVADFDRDGDLDIYLTSVRQGASRLYRARGDGLFDDVSAQAGVLVETPARSCAWSDVDGDGWPDLYVTCPRGANRLFRSRGDGTFVDCAREAGVAVADGQSLGCVFGDVDGDGLDDLFVSNYQSQVSRLFRGLGKGKLRDVTGEAGLGRKASTVGCVLADVLGRGQLDLYVTTDSWLSGANYTEEQLRQQGHTVEPGLLYTNDGKGRFTPVPGIMSKLKTLGHDVVIEDLDHDGLVDIYVGVDAGSGNRWATSKGGNRLWTRPDGKTWQEQSKAWGIDHEANCVCVPAADLDNDGDLDLLLVNFYSQPVLFRNAAGGTSWLRVRAAGTRSSRDGVGARVRVLAEDDSSRLVGYRQIHSGAGYCRCSPLEAHFGLGKAPAKSYRVEVLFPGSSSPVVRTGVKPGQQLVVKEE